VGVSVPDGRSHVAGQRVAYAAPSPEAGRAEVKNV
jgi:hypothetical protein